MMKITSWKVPARLLVIIVVFLLSFRTVEAQDGDGIQVLSTDIVNNFPDDLTFRISVQSQTDITSIKLYFKTQGSLSNQSNPIDIEPAPLVDASYTWDTSNITVAPSTPIIYSWQITDAEGNKLRTPEQLIYYDDLRFDWQELRSPEIILRWYEGEIDFGNKIFDVANRALAQMKGETNLELDFPVIILLYANDDDFNSWLFYGHDWIGGLAFPTLGITTQILPPSSNLSWIENVIPHEIAHLFFFQVINADIYFWPSWLDEGLAQYYEFSGNEAALERVVQAAHDGKLLPLVLISGDFGSDPEQARLAYDQSFSVVFFMLETWGQDGLQKLIANFRKGMGYREAVEGAYQMTWEEFEAGWITWLGVPTTPAPPPTPTLSPLLLLTPSPTPLAETQVSQADSETAVPTLTETPDLGSTEEVEADLNPLKQYIKPSGLIITGVLIVLVLIPAIWINAVNKKSKDKEELKPGDF